MFIIFTVTHTRYIYDLQFLLIHQSSSRLNFLVKVFFYNDFQFNYLGMQKVMLIAFKYLIHFSPENNKLQWVDFWLASSCIMDNVHL